MQLRTKRLLLREYQGNDLEDKFAFESDPLVVKYVCYGPYSRKECRQDLEFHIAHQSASPRRYYHQGLVLPATKRLIGWCGLELKDEKRRDGEIGYVLNRNYWGNGYMLEAAQSILTFGFEQLKFRRIFATLIRLLGDFDLAEDALHEAFRVAMEQWPRDGIPAKPRPWLVSTGRFKVIDTLRRRARFDASWPPCPKSSIVIQRVLSINLTKTSPMIACA